jgi:EmrB/QacA subfamily drug resistance transporter
MQGLFGGVFGLSSVIGPFAGGYITDNLGWRWVFYVNVPVGVLGVLVVLGALPYIRSRMNWRDIDFLGCFTLAAGLVPLLVALSITNTNAWTSPQVLGLLALAVVMLVAFFLVERRADNPVVPFELFRHNAFTVSVMIAFFTAFGMFGTIVFVPLLYQGVLGASATNSGTLMTPMMLGMFGLSMVAGQIMPRLRYYRYLGTAGVLVMIAGMALLAQVTPSSPQWQVVLDIIIVGAGLGLTFPLTITVVQAALPAEVLGVATSQIQFWRNLGGTVGTAVLGSILTRTFGDAIKQRVTDLNLPPQLRQLAGSMGGASPQGLFDPSNIARVRGQLPAQAQQAFDQIIYAIRLGLADSLHGLFLIAGAVMVIALVATVFLKEIPLTGKPSSGLSEAPVVEGDDGGKEREPALAR